MSADPASCRRAVAPRAAEVRQPHETRTTAHAKRMIRHDPLEPKARLVRHARDAAIEQSTDRKTENGAAAALPRVRRRCRRTAEHVSDGDDAGSSSAAPEVRSLALGSARRISSGPSLQRAITVSPARTSARRTTTGRRADNTPCAHQTHEPIRCPRQAPAGRHADRRGVQDAADLSRDDDLPSFSSNVPTPFGGVWLEGRDELPGRPGRSGWPRWGALMYFDERHDMLLSIARRASLGRAAPHALPARRLAGQVAPRRQSSGSRKNIAMAVQH